MTALAMNGPQSVSIVLGAALVDIVNYRILIAITASVILLSGSWPLIRPARPPAPAETPTLAGNEI